VPDLFKATATAVRDERTRICSALIRVRHCLLGKARATRNNGLTVAEAYEDAATLISEFLMRELGGCAEENDR
jgi:hypothetical protein